MTLANYELAVLRMVATDNVPDDPGAAFWAAIEVLIGRGLIQNGQATCAGINLLLEEESKP